MEKGIGNLIIKCAAFMGLAAVLCTFVACGNVNEQKDVDFAEGQASVAQGESMSTTQASVAVTATPAVVTEAPAVGATTEALGTATELPATVTEVPATTEVPSSVTEAPPAATEEAPKVTYLLVNEITYDASGNEKIRVEYSYNDKGWLVKKVSTNAPTASGTYSCKDEYVYDESGVLIEETNRVEAYGSVSESTKYYDAAGRQIKWRSGNDVIEYKYDEKGKLIEEIKESSVTKYEYDQYGNPTLTIAVRNGKSMIIESIAYEYYADGTVRKEEMSDCQTSSELRKKYVKEYDENGVRRVEEWYSWDYDLGQNAILQRVECDEDGKVISRKEYQQGRMIGYIESIFSEEENSITAVTYREDTANPGTFKQVETNVITWKLQFPEYDENGRMVSMKQYLKDLPGLYRFYTYEYDEAGNLVEEIFYEISGGIGTRKEYIYITVPSCS